MIVAKLEQLVQMELEARYFFSKNLLQPWVITACFLVIWIPKSSKKLRHWALRFLARIWLLYIRMQQDCKLIITPSLGRPSWRGLNHQNPAFTPSLEQLKQPETTASSCKTGPPHQLTNKASQTFGVRNALTPRPQLLPASRVGWSGQVGNNTGLHLAMWVKLLLRGCKAFMPRSLSLQISLEGW